MFQTACILALIVGITITIPYISKRLSNAKYTGFLWGIFVIYILGNLYCTTFSRVPDSGRILELRPFRSYLALFKEPIEGGGTVTGLFDWFMKDASPLVVIILNILLYYPLGYLLPILFTTLKPKHVILIGCLCSIATEATQYILKMGWCETDDVIHNTLGTAIGVWVWLCQSKRLNAQWRADSKAGE